MQTTTRSSTSTSPSGFDGQKFSKNLISSIVVFLVALPLCMGIALASGVPASVGIMTGVVGGLVVGALSGSPLQVSGPAAGLVVLVVELAKQHGYHMLGAIIVLAGFFQVISGVFGLGQWFRAVPPAVVHGMLSGIGLLLIGSQFHVMFDSAPGAHGLQNLLHIPQTVIHAFSSGLSTNAMAGILGVVTIVLVALWEKIPAAWSKVFPGALIGIVAVTAGATVLNLPIKHVEIPANIFDSIKLPDFAAISKLPSISEFLLDALALAFVASAETMLTAAALDKMTPLSRTNYDKELKAQGCGNMISGLLGLLPITGVIARSGVNVRAGAQSRQSSVLHGIWLIVFVLLLPGLLKLVPVAALAALLVYTGYKLFLSKEAQELRKYGKSEIAIYATTLISIVSFDLLTGVIVGVVLSVAKLLYIFSHLQVRVEKDEKQPNLINLYLSGAATFLSLPKLAQTLDGFEENSRVYIHVEDVEYIDHACLDLLASWERQHCSKGEGCLVIDWGQLKERYRNRRFTPVGQAEPD